MFHEELDAYLGNNRRDRLYGKSLVKDLMLNEYCPELGRIMEELVSGGLAERLLVMSPVRDSEREIAEFLVFAEEAKEELGKKENFRQDLVDYAIDSVSYALGFLNKVRVPPEAEDDPFDDLEKDYVPYEEQDKYYSVGSMLDIIYEFDDFLDELMLGRAYEYGARRTTASPRPWSKSATCTAAAPASGRTLPGRRAGTGRPLRGTRTGAISQRPALRICCGAGKSLT